MGNCFHAESVRKYEHNKSKQKKKLQLKSYAQLLTISSLTSPKSPHTCTPSKKKCINFARSTEIPVYQTFS